MCVQLCVAQAVHELGLGDALNDVLVERFWGIIMALAPGASGSNASTGTALGRYGWKARMCAMDSADGFIGMLFLLACTPASCWACSPSSLPCQPQASGVSCSC